MTGNFGVKPISLGCARNKSFVLPLLGALFLLAIIGRGLSYLAVLSAAHPYETASRWIFANVPPGAKILGVHWDDKLPLHLPGLDPRAFNYQYHTEEWELRIYEPDTAEQVRRYAQQLAAADALVFPTQRIPGSIPRIPDERPHATALLQLLFAEKLGYRFEVSAKTYPQVLFWGLNDDLADESLSVYDHPKVTIFLNAERLSAEEIERRINSPEQYAPLPSLREILTKNGRIQLGAASSLIDSSVAAFLWWFLLLAVATLAVMPLTFRFLEGRLAFAAAKAIALLLPGGAAWILQRAGILNAGAISGWCVIAAIAALCWYFGKNNRESVRVWARGEVWVGAVACLLAIVRAFQPEIFWGEKPMDAAFLHYFSRGPELPPADPWASGRLLSYYYFGSFLYGWFTSLTGLSPGLSYNLSLITVQTTLALIVWSLMRVCTRSALLASAATFAVVLGSNLEWMKLWFVDGKARNFDFFWATSRLLKSPAISEYAGWSYIFGDLHAHFMSLPLFAAFLLLTTIFFRREAPPATGSVALVGLLMGSLFMINSWDFLAAAGTFTVTGILILLPLQRTKILKQSAPALVVFGVAALVAGAFSVDGLRSGNVHFGFVQYLEFNTIWPFLRHFGVWFLLVLVALGIRGVRGVLIQRLSISGLVFALPPILLEIVCAAQGVTQLPWLLLLVCSLLSYAGAQWALDQEESPAMRLAGLMILVSGYAIAFAELVYLMDRMNTIFKVYNVVWLLLGIGSLMLVLSEVEALACSTRRKVAVLTVACVLALTCFGGVLNTWIMMRFQRVEGPRPTLNGQAFLRTASSDEAQLFEWMNQNIGGTPVVLEAAGSSYGPFTRIAMHTGLPTVVGWEHHLSQRGTPHAISRQRAEAVRKIYTTRYASEARELLMKYNVRFVVVGKLERETYGEVGLSKFEMSNDLFQRVATFGDARLYAVLAHAPTYRGVSRFTSY